MMIRNARNLWSASGLQIWSDFVSAVVFLICSWTKPEIKSDLSSAAPEEEQVQEEKPGNKSEEQQCNSVHVCVLRSSQPEISHHRNKTCSFLLLHDCSSMTPHPSPSSQLLLLLLLTQEELLLSCCDSLFFKKTSSLVTEIGPGQTPTFLWKDTNQHRSPPIA